MMLLRSTLGILALLTLLSSCKTNNSPLVQARNQQIRQEQRGDYYIGRRYWVKGSRTWGWVRKPGQIWDKARLVVTNERYKRNPDRLPEYRPEGGLTSGYDHNREYKLWGSFSNDRVYDPTTNLILPEFVLTNWQLIDKSPGFLFEPGERMSNTRLLRAHVLVATEDQP